MTPQKRKTAYILVQITSFDSRDDRPVSDKRGDPVLFESWAAADKFAFKQGPRGDYYISSLEIS